MINEQRIKETIRGLFDGIAFENDPAGLYDPLRYMISIGGKRIRPQLCLTSYGLFRNKIGEDILHAAAALEVFHSFTLIHDDIMDRSPLRRGKETVWKKWNADTAILSGDVMMIDSYKRLSRIRSRAHGAVMDLFNTTAAQVCEGQQYDMEFETRDDVTMAEYERMIGLKTAVLLACSAKMGALVAGAPDAVCDALYNYGYQLGMAFQVADDYLDAFGDVKVFGKPIGGDIVNNKKSWLMIRACEKSTDRPALQQALALPAGTADEQAAKIDAVKRIYTGLAVDEDAKYEILRYSSLALEAIQGTGLSPIRVEAMRRFAEKLVGRAK